MNSDLIKAKSLFENEEYTCVLCKNEKTISSKKRGVKPLLDLLNTQTDVIGFCAADKIVGSAAAFLYVLLRVKSVYADVMSENASQILSQNGIEPLCNISVKQIFNRQNTDICPMEKAVVGISESLEAKKAIEKRLNELIEKDGNRMTIAQVSEKYGLSADTLRYYEKVGMIPPVTRTESGIRNYTDEDCNWVELAKCMRSAGLPVEAMIEYTRLFKLGDETIPERLQLLLNQREKLYEQQKSTEETIERLNYKISRYENAVKTGKLTWE